MAITIGGITTTITEPLGGTELLEYEQGGVTKKGPVQAIADLVVVPAPLAVFDEGVSAGSPAVSMDFIGANVSVAEISPGVFEVTITGGAGSALAADEEGVEVDAAVVRFNFTGPGVTASQTTPGVVEVAIPGAPALVPFYIAGLQPASTVFPQFLFTEAVTFPANFAGSLLYAKTATTAEQVYNIEKNGVLVGTITIAAFAQTGVFASVGGVPVSFVATDRLEVVTPPTPDATLADVSITMKGARV